jgi:hypothetical protein
MAACEVAVDVHPVDPWTAVDRRAGFTCCPRLSAFVHKVVPRLCTDPVTAVTLSGSALWITGASAS